MAKTTKKDLATFQNEVDHWVEVFGLKDWEIDVVRKDVGTDCVANCDANVAGRQATIALGKAWADKIDERNLWLSAFHEVCELLLFTLRSHIANDDQPHIDGDFHAVIRRLENAFFRWPR
jgi:hypothetical protein